MAKYQMLVKLPPGLGNFVTLFKPRPPAAGKDAQGKEKVYGIILAWPKRQAEKLMVNEVTHDDSGRPKFRQLSLTQAVLEVAEKNWPGEGKVVVEEQQHKVLRDGDRKQSWGLGGMAYVHAKRPESFGPPAVYDARKRRIVTEEERDRLAAAGHDLDKLAPGKADEEAYSGCTLVAQVVLYASNNPLGGRQVCVSLAGAQVTHKGERIGGVRADEDAFEEEPEESEEPKESKGPARKREPWE